MKISNILLRCGGRPYPTMLNSKKFNTYRLYINIVSRIYAIS